MQHFEQTTSDDRYFNYCWWPYQPVAAVEAKFRSVNLLFHSFELAGLAPRAFELVRLLRAAIGSFRTVYGIKWQENRLGWEFYFYDYQRREREVSVSRVLDAIRPLASCPVRVNESLAYFMFSLDIDDDLLSGRRELDVVHMYIGNPGSAVSSGIAYDMKADGGTLQNLYTFFNANSQLREVEEKICCSAHVDATRMPVDQILRPELRGCHTICVANKRQHDTVYFSGVTVDQLQFFLHWLQYPRPLVEFVRQHRSRLDHLLYDVGFDYVGEGDRLSVVKSGYYGVF